MNLNAMIAVLILKGILNEDEGLRLVEHLNDKPQSTVLSDTIAAVAEVIGKPQAAIMPQIGPVGPVQAAETLAAAAHPIVLPEPELAANEAKIDPDQASHAVHKDKSENHEHAKTTSVKKITEKRSKK